MSEPAEKGVDRRRCVLVVEDELFIAFELEAALMDGGFRVLGPVGTVRDAFDLLNSERPDAAVLDVNLGGENVAPVALQLKILGVPFVLATASDSAELARNAAFAGVANLGKPTDLKHLVAAIRTLQA